VAAESKTSKAKKLFELTYRSADDFPPIRPNAPDQLREQIESIRAQTHSLRVKLMEKHYSDSQLDALINFYDSEMGKSILESREHISREYKEQMSKILNSPMANSKGNLGVIVTPRNPDVDDT
jgi:hypothetical protein